MEKYHPQGNRNVERYNLTIVIALRTYVSNHPRDWDIYKSEFTYAYKRINFNHDKFCTIWTRALESTGTTEAKANSNKLGATRRLQTEMEVLDPGHDGAHQPAAFKSTSKIEEELRRTLMEAGRSNQRWLLRKPSSWTERTEKRTPQDRASRRRTVEGEKNLRQNGCHWKGGSVCWEGITFARCIGPEAKVEEADRENR